MDAIGREGVYPDDIPFAPNLACLAMDGKGRLEVTWGEDVSDLSADPENLPPKSEDSIPASLREEPDALPVELHPMGQSLRPAVNIDGTVRGLYPFPPPERLQVTPSLPAAWANRP